MLAGGAIFVAIVATSIFQSTGVDGILSGIFVGLFDGLLVVAAVTAAAVWWLRRQSPASEDGREDSLTKPLQPVLEALEATRRAMIEKVVRRSLWRVPLCIAAGILIWALGRNYRHSGDAFDLLGVVFAAGAVGYAWASAKLSEEYRRMYKESVLPSLAKRHGAITYLAATPPDMKRFEEEHIFRGFDKVTAEDELAGTYHGLPVSIIELKLTAGAGDDKRLIFDGLLVEIALRRRLAGITAVVADAGAYGNFRDWLTRSGRERIRLEDPRFESIYQVWGTDQVAARALLTPAFMERMLALAERPGFDPPLALARDDTLTVAMPKAWSKDLFEPPSYLRPAASGEALVELDKDIAAVLATADAVIDLDPLTREAAFPMRRSQESPVAADGKRQGKQDG